MACYFLTDKKAGKILIPDCIGVSVYNDLDYCTCRKVKKTKIELLERRIVNLERKVRILQSEQK